MKLLSIKLQNFGSYDNLDFNFVEQGLALISGPTGSGKSTLQDAAVWVLYGTTAKNGNVDDVRNWTKLDTPTSGILELITPDNVQITVVRERSKNSNDLYWIERDLLFRGKDSVETQKLLERRLGVSADLYIASAYYNEFSPIGSFFTAKAKDRRELLEKLTDLSVPIKLTERLTNAKKECKKSIVEAASFAEFLRGRFDQLQLTQAGCKRDAARWDEAQKRTIETLQAKQEFFEKEKASKIEALQTKYDRFEQDKDKKTIDLIDKLTKLDEQLCKLPAEKCPTCGQDNKKVLDALLKEDRYKAELKSVSESTNPYQALLLIEQTSENHYDEQIQAELAKSNPFLARSNSIADELSNLESQKLASEAKLSVLKRKCDGYSQLQEFITTLRAQLLQQSIREVQTETNRYLNTYFDGVIKAEFILTASDDLDISIWNNGYLCHYKQLSKGQRGLLKLCFSVAVMKLAANNAGVHFSSLFFDEALDGLDTDLKLKAFNLFSELTLSHETVLIIEHNEELKSLFARTYTVKLKADTSIIETGKHEESKDN